MTWGLYNLLYMAIAALVAAYGAGVLTGYIIWRRN